MPGFGTAADKLLDVASHLPYTDFVDFTTGLVTNVTQALNESNRAQLTEYVHLIDGIGGSLGEFVQKTIGDLDDAARDYLNTAILPAYADDDDSKVLDAQEVTDNTKPIVLAHDAGKKATLAQVFDGLTIADDSGAQQTFAQITAQDSILPKQFIAFARQVLQRSAEVSYKELKALVQLGMQRVVAKTLKIKTSVLFDAKSTDNLTTKVSQYQSDAESNSLNWGLNGSASYKQDKQAKLLKQSFAAAISGGISSSKSSTKFQVSTIDTKSTSNLEANIQISGSVELEFFTDYFPALPLNASSGTPALPA